MRKSWLYVLICVFLTFAIHLPSHAAYNFQEQQRTAPWNWGAPEPSQNREWLVIVYLAGDNDLDGQMCLALKNMERGLGGAGKAEIITLFDRASGDNNSGKLGGWSGTRAYRIKESLREDEINSELIADFGELNMGDPLTLENFIMAALKKYPAKKSALVIGGHSFGWSSLASDGNSPNAPDGKDSLNINELRGALEKVAPSLNGGKFGIIAFKMCFMGQAEVAAACAPFAEYMLAGATTVPGDMDCLEDLRFFNDGADAAGTARNMLQESYGNGVFETELSPKREDVSLALYDLSKAEDFLLSFKALSDKISGAAPRLWRDIAISFSLAFNYGERLRDDGKDKLSGVDLLDWLARLGETPAGYELKQEIDGLEKATDSMILSVKKGCAIPECHGLSFYAPLRDSTLNNDYAATYFNQVTGWYHSLYKIHEARRTAGTPPPRILSVRTGPPVLKSGVTDPKSAADFDIWPIAEIMPLSAPGVEDNKQGWVKAEFDGGDILRCRLKLAYYDAASGAWVVFLEQLLGFNQAGAPIYSEGRNELMRRVDGLAYSFRNGSESVLVCPCETDSGHFTVRGTYQVSRGFIGTMPVEITVDRDLKEIVSIKGFFDNGNGDVNVTVLEPEPEDIFTPDLTMITKDGGFRNVPGRPIRWGDGIKVSADLPRAEVWLLPVVSAESLSGGSADFMGEPVKLAPAPR